MKYERQKINPGVFADILPDGAEMYVRPELPSIEFKRDGIKYSMTDLRLLHPLGVEAFEMCLNTIINDPTATECSIRCNDLDDDTIKIISDIVTGFQFEARKGGRNGFKFDTNGLIHGSMLEKSENGEPAILTFYIDGSFARSIYECYQQHKDAKINLCDIVAYHYEQTKNEMLEYLESKDKELTEV